MATTLKQQVKLNISQPWESRWSKWSQFLGKEDVTPQESLKQALLAKFMQEDGTNPAPSKKYIFTDVVPGEKASNGGEYGFYTVLYPTTVAGVFRVYTECTCDFDDCGTGFEGVWWYSKDDIEQWQKESDLIEEIGSLYGC